MTQVNTRRPPQVTQEGKTDPFVHEKEIAAIAASNAAVWTQR